MSRSTSLFVQNLKFRFFFQEEVEKKFERIDKWKVD